MLLEKYTSNWVENFKDIKLELEKALVGIECLIEHIGSTSVPNLDSKPIIDLDITIMAIRESRIERCLKEREMSQMKFWIL